MSTENEYTPTTEQAHTPTAPTDDEREALIDAIRRSVAGTHGIQAYLAGVFADAVLRAGFRRTVQGEPSDAIVEAFLLEEWKHEGWGYNGGDDLPYCECGHMLGAGLERPTIELDRHRVRAALRAAFQTGGNR